LITKDVTEFAGGSLPTVPMTITGLLHQTKMILKPQHHHSKQRRLLELARFVNLVNLGFLVVVWSVARTSSLTVQHQGVFLQK
jgi:hypothetical protein